MVTDAIFGEKNELALVVNDKGYLMGPQDPKECSLRLLTFLAPSSLLPYINLDLIKNAGVKNVKLYYTYSVYPNQPYGHTDVYRKDLLDFNKKELIAKPIFINKSGNLNRVYNSFSSAFANMKYVHLPIKSIPPTAYNSTDTTSYYNQKDSKFIYYGCPGNSLNPDDPNFFVVDPMVFLPYNYNKKNSTDQYGESIVYDFEAPDFVVGVLLTFDYTAPDGSEKTACFSKRFIPTIVGITSKEAKSCTEILNTRLNLAATFTRIMTRN